MFKDCKGGISGELNSWLQSEWSPKQTKQDIVWKELCTIVSTVNTCGHNWARRKIIFHCDNITVVDIWKKGWLTCCKEIIILVRLLYFCAACYNMHVMITHITRVQIKSNINAISRFQMNRFGLAPSANPHVDSILALPTLSLAS